MNESVVFIGIDTGTTNIKASLYNGSLNEIGVTSRDVTIYVPEDSASEINMIELWEILCDVLKQLKANSDADLWKNLKGIGITGQGDGFWPIDAQGKPVRNAILWNDNRSKELGIELIPGLEDVLRRECANDIYPGSQPALQKWLKINEPENYSKVKYSLHCKDWLNFKLTGRAVSEYSDITCSSGMNIKTLTYIPEIYKLLDIEEILTTMPVPVEPFDIIGNVTNEAAKATGLPEGLPVIAGSIDCCANYAGTDFFSKGEGCTIIGTALINGVCLGFDEINPSDLRGLLLYHVVKGRYIKIMHTMNGTSSVDYMKNLLCPNEDYDKVLAEIERIPIGSKGLMFHPYLNGERAPFKNPFAFSSIFGIQKDHSRYELMRAAYEGLTLSFYDCYRDVSDIKTMYLA